MLGLSPLIADNQKSARSSRITSAIRDDPRLSWTIQSYAAKESDAGAKVMGKSARQSSVARIDVPSFRGPLLHACFYVFVLAFVALAIYYLVRFPSSPWYAIVASIVWLALVAFCVRDAIHDDGGVGRWIIIRVGDVSRQHFVEADVSDDYPPTIRFGYQILNRRFYCLEIERDAISSVDWSTGQATSLAGHDMNDWHVAIWYHHPDGPQREPFPGVREEEVQIVGPSGPKDRIEPFGQAFVAFLQDVGVDLKPTDKPTEFTLTGKSTAA